MSLKPLPPDGTGLPDDAPPQAPGGMECLKRDIALARRELLDMLLYEDRRGYEFQLRVKDSAEMVSLHLARLVVPPGRDAVLSELRESWEAFKHTREAELVPALLAGDHARAEHLAASIQKLRIDRCYALIDQLSEA